MAAPRSARPDPFEVFAAALRGNGAESDAAARTGLIPYIRTHQPDFEDPFHIRAIVAELEAIERGDINRLMIFVPPRHGKSETTTRYFPAWLMGKHPDRGVISASYSQDLSDDFGRRVRNLVSSDVHERIFPDCRISPDSSAARRFNTTAMGTYYAVGRGASITGRGAHYLIIDDPIKDRAEADSEMVRRTLKSWYSEVAYTRLQPDGAVVIVQCMTGDTPVLMANGTERPLCDIRPGDEVATYLDGGVCSSFVTNWASQGPDFCYELKTTSGKVVKANARHPFLVDRDGGLTWVKVLDLKVGDAIVRVGGSRESVRREGNAHTMGVEGPHTRGGDVTNMETESGHIPSGITGNGGMSSVPLRDAIVPFHAGATAYSTTKKHDGQAESVRLLTIPNHVEQGICGTDMGSSPSTMTRSSKNRVVNAPYVDSRPTAKTRRRTGATGYVSTTITRRGGRGGCSATIATSPLGTGGLRKSFSLPLSTYAITLDEIVSITPVGWEDVYDIEVEGTENFIADGLVSHNTRWNPDDLAGWLLEEHGDEKWKVLSLPAIAEEDEPFRKKGEALWPARFNEVDLQRIRAQIGSAAFTSLYQQRPSASEGVIFKRRWLAGRYEELPKLIRVIQVWDTAFKAGAENDYSACTTWGETATHFYLLDAWRGRIEFPGLIAKANDLAAAWGPSAVLIEDKASGQSLIQTLRTSTSLPVLAIKVGSDKVSRANAVSPSVEAGKVLLPVNAPWLDEYLNELCSFPNVKHDDWTDTTTMALEYLNRGRGFVVDENEPAVIFQQRRAQWL